LRPCRSDLDFLRDIKCVVDLDAEVAHRAFYLRVAQEQLDGPEISCAPVDQGRLGPAHGMRGVLERIETDAADPLADKASVLACRQVLIGTAASWEQALAKLSAADAK